MLLGILLAFSGLGLPCPSASPLPKDTGLIKNHLLKELALPSGAILAGTALQMQFLGFDKRAFQEMARRPDPGFHTRVDDYLAFAPIAAAYGLNFAGLKGKNQLKDQCLILIKAELGMLATVNALKEVTEIWRPDGSDHLSFPSGHTAQAFLAASFLGGEFRDRSPLFPIAAYLCAGTVGYLRIRNNRHWLPDVVTGAGIGILCYRAAFLSHKRSPEERKAFRFMIYPGIGKASLGTGFSLSF